MHLLNSSRKARGKLIPRFIRLAIPYLNSEQRWTARGVLFLLVVLMLADTSVSHRPSISKFHDSVLILDGEGGWSLVTAKEYQANLEG